MYLKLIKPPTNFIHSLNILHRWTDFSVVEKDARVLNSQPEANQQQPQYQFIQVVGHTMSKRIRAAAGLRAVCIDVGMFAYGGRAFLEISPDDGHFRAYRSSGDVEEMQTPWVVVDDLTAEVCGSV